MECPPYAGRLFELFIRGSSHGSVADQTEEGFGVPVSGHDSAIGEDEDGHAGEAQFFCKLHAIINHSRLARGFWNRLSGMGILKKGEGFFADNGLCLIISLGMAPQGIKLDIKRNILSFLYDLLHLLMKFGTVRSVRVIKGNDPDFRFRVPHHQGILKGNLGDVHPIQFRKPFLSQIFLIRDGYETS